MTISQTLYSSRTDEWPTPQSFFDALESRVQLYARSMRKAPGMSPEDFAAQTGISVPR
jgi:hypothetical protein